jgi:hypothetical protein
LVHGYPEAVVGELDAVFFEGGLDPSVGLAAHFELLPWWCPHLAAERLDPGIDAVDLGL